MKKLLLLKKIFILFVIIIFLFPTISVYKNYSLADEDNAENAENTTQEETVEDELNKNGKPWKISTFYEYKVDGRLIQEMKENFTKEKKFPRNETYGWSEYVEDGVTYVVLAAPTQEFYNQNSDKLPESNYYFNLGDVVYFKFDPRESNDNNIYRGKILASYYNVTPTGNENYAPQFIYADIGIDDEDADDDKKIEAFNNKSILVSSTGVFPVTMENNSTGTFILNLFAHAFLFIGDLLERLLTAMINDTEIEKVPEVIYTKIDIQKDPRLQEILQLEIVATSDDENESEDESEGVSNTPETQAKSNNEENNGTVAEGNQKTGLYNFTVPTQIINQTGNYTMTFDDYTELPLIPSDLFVLARTKINIIDIDFFNKDNTNTNKFFGLVRTAVLTFSRMMLYISAVLVLTILILRSVMLVMASYTQNPEKAKRARRKIDSLLKNLVLMVFIYFIIIFIMYFYKMIVNILSLGEDVYYPLRLTVPAGYSFNTNMVGAIRTLTLTPNGLYKALFALFYCIIAIVSFIWFLVMLIRMLAIAFCIIVAPLTVIFTVVAEGSGEEVEARGILHFSNWFKLYNILMWMPVLLIVIERIVVLLFN